LIEPGPPSAPLKARWIVLGLLSIAIAGNYYTYDAVAPVADMLRAQRGFTQSQIGLLNAACSMPNIVLALISGLLIDRFGAAKVILFSAALDVAGTALTAWGTPFPIMVTGRVLFGFGEETLLIALLAGLANWFPPRGLALAMSLFFSCARIGSYFADISPSWAGRAYDLGWQGPLWLATALTGVSLIAALLFHRLDATRHAAATAARAAKEALGPWLGLGGFSRSFWYILVLNVLYATVFFPFRSTFSIEYFQDAKGLSLEAAGLVNSWVFFAAIFATPWFGLIADRFGHHGLMMTLGAALMTLTFVILSGTDWSLWISTVLMGLSFSVVPAVIWPATTLSVDPRRLGLAFGIINVLQNLGMALCNLAAGWLNDRYLAGPANPAGYGPMLWMFGTVSFVALLCVMLFWYRESRTSPLT
jgi:MFS family permease